MTEQELQTLGAGVNACLEQQAKWGEILLDLLKRSNELTDAAAAHAQSIRALSATQAKVAEALQAYAEANAATIKRLDELSKPDADDWWRDGPKESQ